MWTNGDPEGRPVKDLRGWTKRQSKRTLRRLITGLPPHVVAEAAAGLARPREPMTAA